MRSEATVRSQTRKGVALACAAAVGVTPERPILIDKFLENAIECEADAISDGKDAYVPAIMEHTRKVIFLESRQMAIVTREGVLIQTLDASKITPVIHNIAWDPVAAEKGEYRHFMQQEIHEQVRALTDTLAGRVDFDDAKIMLYQLNLNEKSAREIKRIIITGCGTAAHAGMVGKVMIERIARIPVEVDIASEMRYRDPIISPGDVVLAISQSGETADTLAAMDEGKQRGAKLWSIVNAIGSQAMRIADGYVSMQTGPEIGVASTKAFTAQVAVLTLIGLRLAQKKGTIPPSRGVSEEIYRFGWVRPERAAPTARES